MMQEVRVSAEDTDLLLLAQQSHPDGPWPGAHGLCLEHYGKTQTLWQLPCGSSLIIKAKGQKFALVS